MNCFFFILPSSRSYSLNLYDMGVNHRTNEQTYTPATQHKCLYDKRHTDHYTQIDDRFERQTQTDV